MHSSPPRPHSCTRLNILEAALQALGIRLCRIDGSMISAEQRSCEVERFQRDADIPVFLLSSAVGSLGLTLTAADRVIM